MKTDNFQKVLIALDYDPTAKKVADIGFSLAKAMGAEVMLLHVIADGTYYSSLEYSPMQGFMGFSNDDFSHLFNEGGLKKATKYFLDKSKQYLGDESILTAIKEGDFADTILAASKEYNIDIIIMGSHSRRWLDEILLGSVTEKVLHHTTIPLFIVPTKKHK